ncbi:hypothetical protein QR680_002356 [Steinernema hermaphroditum]|uniref:Uncharacterized protein n=1 Tax=Steinernema hermaphroditum TaxID=289476 RepID=A0AA39LI65_9BILA|nr:hypothetical protein QR680_002356 [Steinernema hermaphroditum]
MGKTTSLLYNGLKRFDSGLKKPNAEEKEAEAPETDDLKPVDDLEIEKAETKLEMKPLMLKSVRSEKAASVTQTYEKSEKFTHAKSGIRFQARLNND